MKNTIVSLFLLSFFAGLLSCTHASKSLEKSKYMAFNSQARVNPSLYQGVPAVILQNDYMVSMLPNGHVDIKNTRYIQALGKDADKWATTTLIAGLNASGLEWSGRLIGNDGKISGQMGEGHRSNPFELFNAGDQYPRAKKLSIKQSDFDAGQIIEITTTTHWEDNRWLPIIYFSDRLPVKKASLIINAPDSLSPNIQISQDSEPVEAYPQVFPTTFQNFGREPLSGNQYVMIIHDPPNFLRSHSEFSAQAQATQAQITLATGKTGKKPARFIKDHDISHWFLEQVKKLDLKASLIQDKAKQIIKGAQSDREKMTALLKYCQNVATLPAYSNIGSTGFQEPRETIERHAATSRDIAILFYALLDAAHINSQFILSPNNKMKPGLHRVVSPASIDGVILRAKSGNDLIYLDATQEDLALGKISPPFSGQEALAISERSTSRIRLP